MKQECEDVDIRRDVSRLDERPGVEIFGLLGALGDDAELPRVSQHEPLRQRLDQPGEPFVGEGRLDGRCVANRTIRSSSSHARRPRQTTRRPTEAWTITQRLREC